MKPRFSLLLLLSFYLSSQAQDVGKARHILDTLCSPYMAGRGYVKGGDKKAADYIAGEFNRLGLKRLTTDYFQPFQFPINTFPYTIRVRTDNKDLVPGKDFIIPPKSISSHGIFETVWLKKRTLNNPRKLKCLQKKDFSWKALVIDETLVGSPEQMAKVQEFVRNPPSAQAIVSLKKDKLTWRTAQQTGNTAWVEILKDSAAVDFSYLSIDLENQFVEQHATQNVIGYVEGSQYPDSFIVFCSHYDHLGCMGPDTYFPGANDNGSGTTMLLSLAEYYADPAHRPSCSIAFMAFAGEEVGLLGSKHYTSTPLFPLEKIKFVINMDMTGTGEEGITVVNANLHGKEFDKLLALNKEKNYLPDIKSRGQSKNSDHYPFSEKGVKAFFIYTMGGPTFYHDIYDRPVTLPFTEFEDLFRLLNDFTDYLNKPSY